MASSKANLLFSLLFCAFYCICAVHEWEPSQMYREAFGLSDGTNKDCRYMAWIDANLAGPERSFYAFGYGSCAGAIVSDRHILTSALCIDRLTLITRKGLTAILGSPNAALVPISEHVTFHPDYVLPDMTGYPVERRNNHLAILRTTKKIEFSNYIAPIALPDFDYTNQVGLSVVIAGRQMGRLLRYEVFD